MKKEYRTYRFICFLASLLIGFLYHVKVRGRENIPEGAALVCANHSSWADPLLIMFAIKNRHHLHMMAKKELFDMKIVGGLLRSIGSFPVDRSGTDVGAIKTTMRYLKSGDKVVIFPEGTRRGADDEVDAKSGAVRIADKVNVPILPIYIPRRKKTFGKVELVIGEPYYVNDSHEKLSTADYSVMAGRLMDRIANLSTGGCQGVS